MTFRAVDVGINLAAKDLPPLLDNRRISPPLSGHVLLGISGWNRGQFTRPVPLSSCATGEQHGKEQHPARPRDFPLTDSDFIHVVVMGSPVDRFFGRPDRMKIEKRPKDYPKKPVGAWLELAMKKSIGMESMVFTRDARKATRAARAFASGGAATKPMTRC